MRRTILVTLAFAGVIGLSACGAKDPELCDFYHSIGAGYTDSQGYVPSDVQDSIDEYC